MSELHDGMDLTPAALLGSVLSKLAGEDPHPLQQADKAIVILYSDDFPGEPGRMMFFSAMSGMNNMGAISILELAKAEKIRRLIGGAQ